MHSSRMRTARFSGCLERGLSAWRECLLRGVCVQGVSAQGLYVQGVCVKGVCVSSVCVSRVCVSRGMSAHRGVHLPSRGRHPHCMLGYTPPAHCMLGYTHPLCTEWLTDRCKTLPSHNFVCGRKKLVYWNTWLNIHFSTVSSLGWGQRDHNTPKSSEIRSRKKWPWKPKKIFKWKYTTRDTKYYLYNQVCILACWARAIARVIAKFCCLGSTITTTILVLMHI